MNLYMVLFMLTTDLNNYRLSLIAGFFFCKKYRFLFFCYYSSFILVLWFSLIDFIYN